MNLKLSVNTFFVLLFISFSKNELIKNNKSETDYQVFDDSDKLFECGDNKTCAIVCSDDDKNCKIKTEHDKQLKVQTITFCHDDEFLCKNGECINAKFKCDGKQDCLDSSDELNCTKINEDSTIELDCIFPSKPCFGIKQNKTICLPIENFCDNRKHCINGTDEGGFCDKDPCFNSNCTGTCHNTPQGALCYCPEGSTLAADGHSCLKRGSFCDFGVCSQICVPLKNRHKCQCNLNYTLENDGFSCKSNDNRPAYIIFSNRHEIRSVDINSMAMSRPLVSGLKNTIALDFFYSSKGDLIFWTDVIDDKIYKGSIIHGSLINIQVIVETGLSTAEGLAVDWIGENIYWVESNLDQIEVTKFDGSSRKTLIAGNMESPRSVALDSRYRIMFWSDWDTQQPRIESASMSGEDRIVIYNMTNKDGAWPNGLTLDYQNLRIYWVDARTDSIQTITYEGKDHHEILRNHDLSTHPFAITLFGNYIYWTDWKTNSVIKCNKFNGSEVSVVQKVMTQPFDIKVYHPSRQPVLNTTHPCSINNGGCSHLCLLSKKHVFKCECPHIMKLDKNNKTCVPNEKILLFARPNEIRGLDLENIHYHIIPPISLPKIIHTEQLDFHAKEKRIYWADTESNELKRSSLNSSVVEVIMDSVIETPFGFALDWISNNLFVTSQESNAKIYVSKLNGEYIHSLSIQNLSKPFSLAIDPFNGLLFWADHGSENLEPIIHPYIGMSKMDGSNAQKIVSSETEQLISKPTSLTLKFEGFTVIKLYWSNIGSGSIQSYNFKDKKVYTIWNDNANPQKLVLGPYALCLKKNNLMFSSQKHSSLYEISEIGNLTEIPLLKNQSEVITALKIYNKNLQFGQNLCGINNGNCSQLCLPISSTKRKCKCAIGYEVDTKNETNCLGSKEFLICSSNLSLKGISLDQSVDNGTLINSKQLLPPISKVLMAINVDFMYKDSYIYWVDNDEGSITRIKQDSTSHQTVIKNLEAVEGIAIDWIAENIYWIESTYQVIEVSRLNGSSRYVIISGNMTKPTSLAVDPVEGYLFWSDIGDNVQILRSRLDGSERVSIFNESNKSYINKITLDIQDKKIYWSDSKKLIIERSNYDGKNKTLVYRNNFYLKNLVSFTINKEFIYWADTLYENGSILKIQKNSINNTMGNATLVAFKLGDHIKDIKVYHEQPSNKLNPCAINNGGCSELCIFIKNNKHRCICSHGKLSKNGKTCEPYETFIMFSRIVDIDSIQISDDNIHNSPYPIISNKTYMQNVIGLTFDYNSKKIIYSDIQKGSINSMNFNGTDHKVLIDKQGAVEGVAFDSLTNQLYWTSNSDASINRLIISFLSFNNTAEKIIKLSNNDKPRGIAIDSCKSMIYWTNWNVAKPSIQRSFLNGQVMESIITTKIRMPNAITLDHKLQKLYWSDARLDKIERCNYDGSDRIVIITESPQHPFDLAIYGEYLFWTDWVAHGVYRANKFTGADLKMLKKKVPRPMGIIAVANDTEDCTLNQCIKNSSLCMEKPTYSCTDKEFSCDNGLCIPLMFKCDGELDCSDHSDEYPKQNCSKIQCKPDIEFKCKNGECISKAYICDNEKDCKDGSDENEETCVDFKCNTTIEFQCNNHKCISLWQVCDDKDDCGDGSDEKNCVKNKCKINEFKCHKKCIPESSVCNGFNDCSDFSDESPENCLIEKDLICTLKEKKVCKNFNICDKRVCSQFCNSTSGTYNCSCANGFKNLKNGTSCLVDSSLSPVLLFSNRFVIRQTDLNGYESNQKVSYLRNAVALDFDYSERCIYWSNIMPLGSLIERSCDGKKDLYGHPLKETIQSKNILSPDGLAVDWIGKNLYWCDKIKDTIEVSKLDGKYRKTIMNKNLQEPRAIVLDPYSGNMYWTDWGIKPYIGKAGMDGSNFKIVVSENLGWPNALAIDYITKELFWADAKEDYIAVADYDGKRKSIIVSELNSNAINHVFALSVFEDYIYWTDWDSKSVQKCNKYSCKNSTKLADVLHRPMDIQVYHPFRQEPLNHSNPCEILNCQTICLLKPGSNPNELSATCACPENFVLNADKKTCSSNCSSSQFVCLNSFKCVNYWSKYEQETCNNQTCVPDYTYCKRGHCLENKWVCEKPYTCLDKDFCYNNGRCYIDKSIVANETSFLPKCECKSQNFKGDRCEHCENLNCKNGGYCILSNNSTESECRCLEGFYGKDCSKQLIDHCGCKNEGFCEIDKKSKTYSCICPNNYMGKHCEIYIATSCLKTKCKNNGVCKMNQDDQQTYCQCPKEFRGVFCEIPVVETKCEKNCLNGGTCVLIDKTSTCKCKNENYKGDRCESFIENQIEVPKEQKSSKKSFYIFISFGFVTFLIIFFIIGFTFNFYKRNLLFTHQRMNETHENLEIRNPIFDEDLNDENFTENSNYDYSYNNDERKGITNISYSFDSPKLDESRNLLLDDEKDRPTSSQNQENAKLHPLA